MALVRNVVRDVVRNVVRGIEGIDIGVSIPDSILGFALCQNLKLEGVVNVEDFTSEEIIGLIFNFKL